MSKTPQGTGFGGLRLRQTKRMGTVLLVSLCDTKRTVPAVSLEPQFR